MKLRKIFIKNHKMFKNAALDLTDKNNKTLDIIVLAGINGSGKTSLLQLIGKLFSEKSNILKIDRPLDKFEEENKAIICDEVKVEIEFSGQEKKNIKNLIKKLRSRISELIKHDIEIGLADKKILTNLKNFNRKLSGNNRYLELIYKLKKINENYIIERNDFLLFGILPENRLKRIFKIPYFAASHDDIKKDNNYNINEIKSDGIVMPIDIFSHTDTIKHYLVDLIKNKIMEERDLTGHEVTDKYVAEVNKLLNGISMNTRMVDVTKDEPVFENFQGRMIPSDMLSGGEKQLYYKAILLHKIKPENSVILVDEPENSLHPTWQQEVIKFYKNISKNNNQVILATHSPHIIASIYPKNLFLLYSNMETKQIEIINAEKAGYHTRGSEADFILVDIMETPRRDKEAEELVQKVADLLRLHPDKIDEKNNKKLIEELIENLGERDPLVMRIHNRISFIKKEREKV